MREPKSQNLDSVVRRINEKNPFLQKSEYVLCRFLPSREFCKPKIDFSAPMTYNGAFEENAEGFFDYSAKVKEATADFFE